MESPQRVGPDCKESPVKFRVLEEKVLVIVGNGDGRWKGHLTKRQIGAYGVFNFSDSNRASFGASGCLLAKGPDGQSGFRFPAFPKYSIASFRNPVEIVELQ